MAAAPPAQAAIGDPLFFTACGLSHRSADDPIVHARMPGHAHSHDFTGAWSTDAFSTLRTLRASGTTCDIPADTAGYWTPTLYDSAGTPIEGKTFAYYMAEGKPRGSIRAHPAGLKIVADMGAHRAGGWHCGDGRQKAQGGTLSRDRIPSCPKTVATSLQARVIFPDCWDGKRLDSRDHRSHMAYASFNFHRCPASHPVPVPMLNLKTKYKTYGGPGLTLSSGKPVTYHADFFNAWHQAELEHLVDFCIRRPGFNHGPPCRGNETNPRNPSFPKPTTPAVAPPSVVRLTLSVRRFAVGRRGARLVPRLARRRRGTRFRFVLTEPGRVRIRVDRAVKGHKSRRFRRVGFITRSRLRTRGSIGFSGRLRRRALRPGRYRARLTAVDALGNRGRPRTVRFRIIR